MTCLNCKTDFTPHPDDLSFYEKLGVPQPKYCPSCRMQRRLMHRNERTLYRRPCSRCEKEGVSIYPAGTKWPVYCNPCWWGDGWDGKEFGQVYDPSRSFIEQYIELRDKVPRINLLCITSVNSEYTNNAEDNKNCYLLFAAGKNEDCMYGRLVEHCKSVVDCCWTYDSELCYECLDCRQCYGCLYCERCQTSKDLLFCFDVRDSQDCILSSNLRHAQYYIENVKYDKETFLKKKAEILASQESVEAAKRKFTEMKQKAIVKDAFQTKCHNATGDYLYNCRDSRMMFDASNAKDCAYCADVEDPIDCLDCNNAYYKPELCLDVMGTLQSYNCKFSTYIMYCTNCEYSDGLQNCSDCFGCIGLKKAKYCILNTQYSRDEYLAEISKIKSQMSKDGVYGDFLPPETSPFKYNETMAKDYFTLSEAEAKSKGIPWEEITTGTYGKENEKDVFACQGNNPSGILGTPCGRNFKITPNEFAFYERMGLPLPRKDFECRMQSRLRQRNPRKLWKRTCAKCNADVETTYAPERPEAVYCETCYQSKIA